MTTRWYLVSFDPFPLCLAFFQSLLIKRILLKFSTKSWERTWWTARIKDSALFHHPPAENWVKDLLSIALPTREIQSVPHIRKLVPSLLKNCNHRKLNNVITWITTLYNSWNYQSCHAGPPKMDKSWDRRDLMHGEELASHQHSCLRTPMNSKKGKEYHTEGWDTRLVGVQCATRKEWIDSSKRNEAGRAKAETTPNCGCL